METLAAIYIIGMFTTLAFTYFTGIPFAVKVIFCIFFPLTWIAVLMLYVLSLFNVIEIKE